MHIPVEKWKQFGRNSNASFYEVEEGVVAIVPDEGATNDAASAQTAMDQLNAHLRATSSRAAVLVFLDPVTHQTPEARTVYREAADPQLQVAFALVGGSFFGRAVGSLLLGLSKLPSPTKLFATLEEALEWSRAQVKKT